MTAEVCRIIFWLSVVLVFYEYFGYPLLARLVARLRPRPVRKADYEPRVSLIIAAYNEERTIRAKLENTLELDYPAERLEILVAAYGSNDETVAIANEFRQRGVRVLHRPEREGKTSALNRAVEEAGGEVLFFSDANTFYGKQTVRTMMRNFADPEVGGASGRKIVLPDHARQASDGEQAYWGYEAALKECESRIGSVVTADGEIFAMRRCLYEKMPASIVHDDMFLTLRLVQRGYRVVFESEATSAEYASPTLWDEFHLKVRYASAGYQILARYFWMLVPPRSWFAIEFLSHKLLRWTAPFFLIAALVSSAFAGGTFYWLAFGAQAAFYAAALASSLVPHRSQGLLYFPLYFSVMNTAALYGFARYFTGGQSPLWRKAPR